MSDAGDTKGGGAELGGLIGRKLGMTQVFTPAGELVPVTVIELGPCTVVATRQKARDGYVAAQLGFGSVKESRLRKPARGQFAKAGTTRPCRNCGPVAMNKPCIDRFFGS